MKILIWSIVILVVCGIVAAFAVPAMRGKSKGEGPITAVKLESVSRGDLGLCDLRQP